MKAPTNPRRAAVLGLVAAAGLMAAAPAHEAFACGYHDPQTASRGLLNWIYPDSLHVIGAISREVATRRLPLSNFDRTGVDLFGRRYRATKMALDRFGEMLRATSPGPSQPISLVLVEPMLWTRFEPSGDGLHAKVHVSGAESGDLVLVSGEAVLGEIAARRLSFGDAVERGTVRLYGTEPQIAEFVLTFGQVGASDGHADTQQPPDASLFTASAGQTGLTAQQSFPADTTPAELGCTPDHQKTSFHRERDHD
jgi:hypothetical protein